MLLTICQNFRVTFLELTPELVHECTAAIRCRFGNTVREQFRGDDGRNDIGHLVHRIVRYVLLDW